MLQKILKRLRVQDSAFINDSKDPVTFEQAVKNAQAAWQKELKDHMSHLGIVVLPGYDILPPQCLDNCRLVPDRQTILQRMPRNAKVAELGVQEGHFSEDILAICAPSELHLIDIDLTTFNVAEKFSTREDIVSLHEGDSAETILTFPDGYFDFLYIDADHSYEGVKRDIAACAGKVKSDGYLLFNDYTYWSSAECMPYGVMHAVNAFCIAEQWELVYFAFGHHGYSDVALRRIDR